MSYILRRLWTTDTRSQLMFAPCIAWAVLAALAGCSGGGIAGLYPVTGTVTYQGKPVDGATVSFINQGDGRPATAVTQSDGRYTLYTVNSPGALPGSYSVLVTKTESLPEGSTEDPGFDPVTGEDLSMEQAAADVNKRQPKAKELIPAKYGNPQTSPLTLEVMNADNVFDLKLD